MSTQFALANASVPPVAPVMFVPPSRLARLPLPAAEPTDAWDRVLPAAGTVMSLPPDREIYGEGEKVTSLFRVVSGVVRTCKFLSDGRRQIDAFYRVGDVFGYEAGAVYRMTAESVSRCTLVAYRRSHIDLQAAGDEALLQQILAHALTGIQRTQDHVVLLGRKSALEKVASFVLELAGPRPGKRPVALPMTRQDIADYLGLTLETVSRTFSQLERDGLIQLSGARQVILKDITALHDMQS